jgi:hypothetical protein
MQMNIIEKIAQRLPYYEELVERGIGGFILFGGEKKEIKYAIKALQKKAQIPLFIGSDLEQGLGQHIDGGTLFPPALAFARAINREKRKDLLLLRKAVLIPIRKIRLSVRGPLVMIPKGLHGSAGNLSRASTEKELLPAVNIFPAMEIHPVIHTENYL